MKIDRLDAHDRYEHFTKQDFDIGECCQDLINKRPFGDHPFYIFAHTRTDDDGVTKRLIWQPRLTKPKAQSNSMLFKAYPGTDLVKILWMLPAPELWGQYDKGLLTENKIVSESIHDFRYNRKKLEEKEEDDISDERIDQIYKELSHNARKEKESVDLIKRANPVSGNSPPRFKGLDI
jgi:hypothetical protein